MKLKLILFLSLFAAHYLLAQYPCQSSNPIPEFVETTDAVRGLYVSSFESILGIPSKENYLIAYALYHGFNYLVLYDVAGPGANGLFDATYYDAAELTVNRLKLNVFINKARVGGLDIGINVGSWNSAQRALWYYDFVGLTLAFHQFQALHYESEYWNSGSSIEFWDNPGGFPNVDSAINSWSENLAEISLACQARDIIAEVYIGNPTNVGSTYDPQGQEEVDWMTSHADRIQVAYFVETPLSNTPNIFSSKLYRTEYLALSAGPADIVLLFNANHVPPHGDDMSTWLQYYIANNGGNYTNALKSPYNIYMTCPDAFLDHDAGTATSNVPYSLANIDVQGFSWFNYKGIRKPIFLKASKQHRKVIQDEMKGIRHVLKELRAKWKASRKRR